LNPGNQQTEKAVLVGTWNRANPEALLDDFLDELALLSETAGAKITRVFKQHLEKSLPGTYIGSGKLKEIAEYIKENQVELIIFDDDLSPTQVKNIDEAVGVKVFDRSGIILHIFSERARTAQAKAQVELAHLQYLLPRLTGLWTHLSKQKGGIGLKGAGEKEIETDRRIIRDKIAKLKLQLKKIDKQNITRRKTRGEMIRVSLVGYTNAGKSTLLNILSKSSVLAEDKLFATLDTTVRKVVVDQTPFLLSDTVGFIRKLPHDLIECFKSTLDEVRESDILLHVVDISHPNFERQIEVVNETLAAIGVKDKPTLVAFNKVDRIPEADRKSFGESWFSKVNTPAVMISAAKKINLGELRKMLIREIRNMYKVRYPYMNFSNGYEQEYANAGSDGKKD